MSLLTELFICFHNIVYYFYTVVSEFTRYFYNIIRLISDHYPVFAREKFPTLPEDSISIDYRVFLMRTYQSLKIHYKILTGTRY